MDMLSKPEGTGRKVASELAKGNARMRSDMIAERASATTNPVRFDRTLDSAAWPTSAPARERPSPMKVLWKHDAAGGGSQ